MQFRTIRTAFDHEDNIVRASELTPRSRGTWLCRSCRSALRLCWRHDNGGYFEHDLEVAENIILKHCEYLITSSPPPPSPFTQAVSEILQRTESKPKKPSSRDYVCVLCQYEYHGSRQCPGCGEHIYITEMKDLDTVTRPKKFAQ
ncbi:putative zinc ribbon protein [Enterobacter asburiae]|uniref:putative zinc ribbon protein n=1 Tax=Enterobacter asburiae TaxID=61645 RepID=UPI0011D280E5|nr:putative zinc ribbon protein [Enterobacter asburiae]